MRKIIMSKSKQLVITLMLVVVSLGVGHAATPPGKQVYASGLAQGGSNVTFTWHVPVAGTYKVHVQVPDDGTATDARYRVYPYGNATNNKDCSSIDPISPCFEVTVDQQLIKQVIVENAWTQLTMNRQTSTQWKFTKDGFVSVNPSNLVTLENLSVGAVSFEGKGATTGTTDVSSGVLKIGKTYQGGIIFYLDSTGKHGLVAAPQDQSTGVTWAAAIQLCSNLVLGGRSDWYLPSKEELNLMYKNIGFGAAGALKGVGGFASNYYWSSSDSSSDYAWNQGFNNGDQDSDTKNYTLYVRAVRAF
jgi:hypothetical protein